MNLERRVALLENRRASGKEPKTIFVVWQRPGDDPAAWERLTAGGRTWLREPDEPESDFKARALRECPARANCVTLFFVN